jgi:hypothetical protein
MRFAWELTAGVGLWVVVLGLILFWPIVPLLALIGWGVVRWRIRRERRRGTLQLWSCQLCRADVTRSGERCGSCGTLIEWAQ